MSRRIEGFKAIALKDVRTKFVNLVLKSDDPIERACYVCELIEELFKGVGDSKDTSIDEAELYEDIFDIFQEFIDPAYSSL